VSDMKRYLILGVVAAGLILLLLLGWPRRSGSSGMPAVSEVTTPQAVEIPDAGSKVAAESLARPKRDGVPPAIPEAELEKYRKEMSAAERFYNQDHNAPVAFYGLVVDQDAN